MTPPTEQEAKIIRSFLETNGLTADDCLKVSNGINDTYETDEMKASQIAAKQLNTILLSRLPTAEKQETKEDTEWEYASGEEARGFEWKRSECEHYSDTSGGWVKCKFDSCFSSENVFLHSGKYRRKRIQPTSQAEDKPTALQVVERPKQVCGVWLAAHDQFTCPDCGGHHFGSTLKDRENSFGLITERQCHDEHGKGCHWSGPYYFPSDLASLARYGLDAHTKLTAAEKRIAELSEQVEAGKVAN